MLYPDPTIDHAEKLRELGVPDLFTLRGLTGISEADFISNPFQYHETLYFQSLAGESRDKKVQFTSLERLANQNKKTGDILKGIYPALAAVHILDVLKVILPKQKGNESSVLVITKSSPEKGRTIFIFAHWRNLRHELNKGKQHPVEEGWHIFVCDDLRTLGALPVNTRVIHTEFVII